MKIKYPKGETVWESISDGKAVRFIVTSKPSRDYYMLYKVNDDGSVIKIARGKTPAELREKYEL